MIQRILYLSALFISALNVNAQQTVGLFTQTTGSLNGYVLFTPLPSRNTYLIDKCGYLVHEWTSTHPPGLSVYLLQDGTLLRPGSVGNSIFNSGGNGGIIQRFDWNSNVLWAYTISSTTECQHHDVKMLPNGNILAIVWELFTPAQAIAAGRDSTTIGVSLWSEKIVEIQPIGSDSGNIVWQWHVWDHLVQDHDSTKANYGVVADHPELLNLNYNGPVFADANPVDWLHCNGLDYNADLDQIILSSHNLSELWIIDHSTTTAEAASHSGGVHGKGGDFLYRWGNPAVYNRGTANNQILFGQHNPHWIENGLPDSGKVMVFNNGWDRPAGNYSQVYVFVPPVDSAGDYSLTSGQPYLPDSAYWNYTAPMPTDFYSQIISGAQRLSNGNTIIDEGTSGDFFEIDTAKNTVWRYVNPVQQGGAVTQGTVVTTNSVFRCTLYEPSYLGFTGHTLTPGSPIELNPLSYSCTMLTGINELAAAGNSSVSITNPFSDELFLRANDDLINATATLTDVTGQVIEIFTNVNLISENSTTLSLKNHLADGVYLLNLKSSTQNFTAKLIHQ